MAILYCGLSIYPRPVPHCISAKHYCDVKWLSWHHELLVDWVFVQHFVQTDNKETSGLHYCPFVRGIHSSQLDSPHKGTVKLNMLSFDDMIMKNWWRHPIAHPHWSAMECLWWVLWWDLMGVQFITDIYMGYIPICFYVSCHVCFHWCWCLYVCIVHFRWVLMDDHYHVMRYA